MLGGSSLRALLLDLGAISEREFWKKAGSVLGLTPEESADLGDSYFSSYRLNEPLLELVQRARQAGCRSGICSNGFRDAERAGSRALQYLGGGTIVAAELLLGPLVDA